MKKIYPSTIEILKKLGSSNEWITGTGNDATYAWRYEDKLEMLRKKINEICIALARL